MLIHSLCFHLRSLPVISSKKPYSVHAVCFMAPLGQLSQGWKQRFLRFRTYLKYCNRGSRNCFRSDFFLWLVRLLLSEETQLVGAKWVHKESLRRMTSNNLSKPRGKSNTGCASLRMSSHRHYKSLVGWCAIDILLQTAHILKLDLSSWFSILRLGSNGHHIMN